MTVEKSADWDARFARAGDGVPAPRSPERADLGQPTVGLVTAIPEEFVAMRALLEGIWAQDVDGDPAHYLRGRLPSRDVRRHHNVVLTQLSATATNAAADGCAQLLRSFPSVDVLIMVGIAAGIPNPVRPDRHVRLGDIVVATHGIVDYDHVRALPGGPVPRQQFPSPSPRLARCADMLKQDELAGERPWERWLDPKQPPLLPGYGRPSEGSDILFDAAGGRLDHPRRDKSGHRKGFPKLHHGLIGSADRSVRDVVTRDQLAAEHGFLAIEMEGAGIGVSGFLNGREWFVVRGISDYGDPHRDETWRRYASLTAAAYARALLAKSLPLE
jgi:nucleoside phosphorylase